MSKREKAKDGLGEDPLAGDDPLLETLYSVDAEPKAAKPRRARSKPARRERQPLPEGKTFRLVTFSFYEEDVERLDQLLADAKAKGHRRVSRSQIVRLALRQVDLEDLPESI